MKLDNRTGKLHNEVMPTPDIREDFAGPGGWSQALAMLGHGERAVGYEWDPTSKADPQPAVATARAAGHTRVQADVRYVEWAGPLAGYIGSPPCQPFSAAGNGAGRKHLGALIQAAHWVAKGDSVKAALHAVADQVLDERSELVLHPLTVIAARHPEWVALEQVPTVQPIWDAYAEILDAMGYNVVTGILHAEQYGVPQTRRRAVLIAHLDRPVAMPTPTHSRYYPRDKTRLDPSVASWVSMATALGGLDGLTVVSNNESRQAGGRTKRAARSTAGPSLTVTSATDRWVMRSNYGTGGNPANRGERTSEEPAPTITSKVDRNRILPAWAHERPSTTIVGSYRPEIVAAPKYRTTVSRQDEPDSVRVTVAEAGVLQSFPADYPWQGAKGRQYQQVGNAIPPLLARVVLEQLL